jgi:hypothetical protein
LVKGVNTLLKANIWIGGSYKKQVGKDGAIMITSMALFYTFERVANEDERE